MSGCCGNSKKDNSKENLLNPQDGIVLKIEGMTCGHCKNSVEKALANVPGVSHVEVNLADKQAVVIGTADPSILAKAVDEAGYRVINS